jgi:hypothetical protein
MRDTTAKRVTPIASPCQLAHGALRGAAHQDNCLLRPSGSWTNPKV